MFSVTFPRVPYAAATALASALMLVACGSAEEPAPVETDPMAGLVGPEPTSSSAQPTDAQGFVDKAAASDLYEIEAGKLAQQMGTSQEVKDFGAMMERDHTQSSADMKAAAAQADGVTVAAKLTPRQEADLAALRGAGQNFDSLYKTQQLAAHRDALALLQSFASGGDAPALRDFAGKAAPVVEGHLETADKLP